MQNLPERWVENPQDEEPLSASDLAYNALLDMILTGALRTGSLLREQALAEAVGVSRTPLREALSRLSGEGLVARHGNRSLVVKPVTVREYIEALHVRALLERETAARAAGRMPAETIEELRGQVEALIADPEPQERDHWAVDDAVHEAIARASNNELMAGMIKGLKRKTHLFDLKRMPNRFLPGCNEHLAVLDAIAAGDGDAAGRAMAAHIENVKASILEKLAEI